MDTKMQVLNLLGLARRAGKLTTGEELVVRAIQSDRVKLVFLASDASQNLTKKINDKAGNHQVSVSTIFSESELSQAIGSARKVVALLDLGFARKMEILMN